MYRVSLLFAIILFLKLCENRVYNFLKKLFDPSCEKKKKNRDIVQQMISMKSNIIYQFFFKKIINQISYIYMILTFITCNNIQIQLICRNKIRTPCIASSDFNRKIRTDIAYQSLKDINLTLKYGRNSRNTWEVIASIELESLCFRA